MKFEVRTEEFADFVEPTAELEKIAGGFGFTEGPIWHPTENWLVFSDIQESHQYRWTETDGVSVFRTPSNQSNGNCFAKDGSIITCEHASSHLVRHDHGGKRVTAIATHFDGKELNSPNDVICDAKGRIWFTDPSFGRIREDLGLLRDQELDFQGVFRLDPDGGLHCIAKDFQQPNGLCFSADEERLFVNDSWGGHIRVFDVNDAGNVSGGAVWAEIGGEGEGVPDGMKCTDDGHILCNGPGGVHVVNPAGEAMGIILTPEKSTNFCFGGAGSGMLYITASTSVYRIQTRFSGLSMI